MRNLLFATLAALVLLSCGDNQDETGADSLLDRVESENYRSWRRAPNFPQRVQSATSHSGAVEIFLNPTMANAIDAPMPAEGSWPVGSVVVKEGYTSVEGDLRLVAIMEKRDSGWYYAEYFGGSPRYSGRPKICTNCHERPGAFDAMWGFGFRK